VVTLSPNWPSGLMSLVMVISIVVIGSVMLVPFVGQCHVVAEGAGSSLRPPFHRVRHTVAFYRAMSSY
jgi:hypothetical protein